MLKYITFALGLWSNNVSTAAIYKKDQVSSSETQSALNPTSVPESDVNIHRRDEYDVSQLACQFIGCNSRFRNSGRRASDWDYIDERDIYYDSNGNAYNEAYDGSRSYPGDSYRRRRYYNRYNGLDYDDDYYTPGYSTRLNSYQNTDYLSALINPSTINAGMNLFSSFFQ